VNRHATLRLASAAGLAASLLLGCTVPRNGDGHSDSLPFVIDGIVIRNELAYPVTDVMIEVPATGAFAGCGNVLPRTACSNAFQGVDYRSSAVLVHWRERGAEHSTGEFVIEIPERLQPGNPAVIEVVIFAPGQAGARLVQR
jgi:hypothetical protein